MILSYCIVHILVALRVRVIWRNTPWISHFICALLATYVVATTVLTNVATSQMARACVTSSLISVFLGGWDGKCIDLKKTFCEQLGSIGIRSPMRVLDR